MSFMEYNNFRDNIDPTMFDYTSTNVLNWIKENRTEEEFAKDPNAYEMTNLFLFGAKYRRRGRANRYRNFKRNVGNKKSRFFKL